MFVKYLYCDFSVVMVKLFHFSNTYQEQKIIFCCVVQ